MRPGIVFNVTKASQFSQRYRDMMVFIGFFGTLAVLLFIITGISRAIHGGDTAFHLAMLVGTVVVFGGLFRWQRVLEDNRLVRAEVVRAVLDFAWSDEAKTLLSLSLARAPHQPLTQGVLRKVARVHVASQTNAPKLDETNEALHARYGLQIGNML